MKVSASSMHRWVIIWETVCFGEGVGSLRPAPQSVCGFLTSFLVSKGINSVTEAGLPSSSRIHPTFHVSKVKPVKESPLSLTHTCVPLVICPCVYKMCSPILTCRIVLFPRDSIPAIFLCLFGNFMYYSITGWFRQAQVLFVVRVPLSAIFDTFACSVCQPVYWPLLQLNDLYFLPWSESDFAISFLPETPVFSSFPLYYFQVISSLILKFKYGSKNHK